MDGVKRIGRVLIAAGIRDRFFTREVRGRDEGRLVEAGVPVTTIELDAAHEWTQAFGGGLALPGWSLLQAIAATVLLANAGGWSAAR